VGAGPPDRSIAALRTITLVAGFVVVAAIGVGTLLIGSNDPATEPARADTTSTTSRPGARSPYLLPGGEPRIAGLNAVEWLDASGWSTTHGGTEPDGLTEECMPPHLLDATTSRYFTDMRADDGDVEIELAFAVYADGEAAAAGLEAARSTAWVSCEQDRIARDVHVERTGMLAAPGSTDVLTYEDGGRPVTIAVSNIVVGRVLATIRYCDCAVVDRQAVARWVAAALADVQHMSAPG
jgi:hypothetical protein